MKKRVFMIVLDSVGVGALPDWRDYDTEPGNTLGNTAEAVGGLAMPHCQKLGLGNILPLKGVAPAENPLAAYGKAPLTTCGKDTTAGHWEMMGIVLEQSFPVFPEGFPAAFVAELEAAFGHGILCNLPYSGTAAIEDFGEEHMATKKPIVYTSADSVLQIACHEDVYPIEELYDLCKKARELAKGPYGVGRVIARPLWGNRTALNEPKIARTFPFCPLVPTISPHWKKRGSKPLVWARSAIFSPWKALVRPCRSRATPSAWKKPSACWTPRKKASSL